MRNSAFSLLAGIAGWLVIVAVPGAFFAFGWKDINVHCQRRSIGESPFCRVGESFSMRLYTRSVVAENVTGIGYRTSTAKQVGAKTGFVTVHPSTLVFETTQGEVPIGHVTSAVDHSAERELIMKTRSFLDDPKALDFRHEVGIHGLFGYVGLIGVAILLFIFLAVLRHHVGKAWSHR